MAEKTKANTKRFAHPSPYSTWTAFAMLLPVLAVIAAPAMMGVKSMIT